MQETQVQSLGWEDPLKNEMTNHSKILAWEIATDHALAKSWTQLSEGAHTQSENTHTQIFEFLEREQCNIMR